MPDLFSYRVEAQQRKKDALDRVAAHAGVEWQDKVLAIIRHLAQTLEEFTPARVRYECDQQDVEAPHHPNAWGSVFRTAQRIGLVEHTGRVVSSSYPPSSNARKVPVYRSKIR